ncbi:hypothetical protein F4779DRAFT_639230 [Xylariaceae sp. FL0662B]|nr:hypothetical protein F4779DRAFT_639230 [Xylariaceae sp. FL0662B]
MKAKAKGSANKPLSAWALIFDQEDNRKGDLYLPRYLYLSNTKPKIRKDLEWNNLVTGACFSFIGEQLYIITGTPNSPTNRSDFKPIVPTPLRFVYMGQVVPQSERDYNVIEVDKKLIPIPEAGKELAGSSLPFDDEWRNDSDGEFSMITILRGFGTPPEGIRMITCVPEAAGLSAATGIAKLRTRPHIYNDMYGALVVHWNKAVGIVVGVDDDTESHSDHRFHVRVFDGPFFDAVAMSINPALDSSQIQHKIWTGFGKEL